MLIFNVIIFILVTKVLLTHRKKQIERTKGEKDNKKVVIGTVKTLLGIVSIMVTFGLSWLFGALSISEAAMVFQWLFVIFSTTQGLVMFIFFCVIAKDARKQWKQLLTCYRYEAKTSVASSSRYSSSVSKSKLTKDTSITSRKNSSFSGNSDLESSVKVEIITTGFTDSVESTFSNGHTDLESSQEVSESDLQLSPQSLQKRPHLDSITEQVESDC